MIVRDITDDDWPGVALLTATSFGSFWRPETVTAWRTLMPPRSSVVVSDGDDVVAMAHYLDLKLTVPGGAVLPVAGITLRSVSSIARGSPSKSSPPMYTAIGVGAQCSPTQVSLSSTPHSTKN